LKAGECIIPMSAFRLFCNVTQCRLVVTDVSGQHIGPFSRFRHSKKTWTTLPLQMGPDSLSRNVGNYNLRCVTSKKSEDLMSVPKLRS
jgi:hypothetical protein